MIKKSTQYIYGAGDLTIAIPLSVIAFFQLFFMTDVAGLPPALAAWALLIGKLWDGINDPFLGLLMDKTRSRFGNRRLFIAVGLIPMSIGFWALWQVPNLSQVWLAVYYGVMIIIFDSFFTMVHIGYNAMTPELSLDYDERTKINGIRMVFQLVGTLGSVILLTVLGWYVVDQQSLFNLTSLGLILFMIPPQLGVLGVTKNLKNPEPVTLKLKGMIVSTLKNKPFQLLIGMYLLSWTSASILSAVLLYFARYYLLVPELANYYVLVAQGSAILFMPMMVRLSKNLDKRKAFLIGNTAWIIAALGISALPQDGYRMAFVLAGFCGIGIATAYLIPWSMIPDIIEHDQESTGERREGAYYAFAAFFQKLGTALALWLMGLSLDAAGYGFDPYQASSVQTIRFLMGPLPAILLIAASIIALIFPITREGHNQRLEVLGLNQES